jgi:pantoate--beta-alanine ligase
MLTIYNGGPSTVQTIDKVNALKTKIAAIRATGKRIALVPTMGALHDGHLALVEEAQRRADSVIVSIFVNPKQFGPNEDLDAYPRTLEADRAKLLAAGVDSLWLPSVAEMYPPGFATVITVANLPNRLCGAARPSHFDGVTTVVSKLFNQVRPDIAVFGEKDWQQLAIIHRLTIDLDFGIEIIGLPTRRAEDGLALSSRNANLSAKERVVAVALPRALLTAKAAIEAGQPVSLALQSAQASLIAAGFHTVDYVAYVDAKSLEPLFEQGAEGRLLAAAKLGKTRLIDNFGVAARGVR